MNGLEALTQSELRGWVASIVEEVIKEKLGEFVIKHEREAREISLVERLLRVEEELKFLRQLEEERFGALLKEMNIRFEAMNARFEALQKEMNTRFEALQKEMNTRFEAMNARFEALQREIDTRFEALERRFNFLQWLIIGGFSFLSLLLVLIRFGS
ncbi:MAG: hypothetical protein N2327_00550 [Caldimicrobium sp.]|nr:hypothetical protein [Caldimicrobium sp.]MCX7872912.1 hypothetical protein [Caldimicrobium sp.]MDW8094487.1 hypothetical protein [Caldimicrobium sp.]